MKLSFWVFTLILLVHPLFSQDVKDIIDEVQDKYDDIKDLTASFKKIDSFKLTGTVNEEVGKIYVKDGEKYRFESEDQTVVTDGKNVWTYNKVTNQLVIDVVRKNSGALLPRDMLFTYPKEYYSSLLGTDKLNGNKVFLVKLDPRDNVHGYVKSMKLWVEDDEWLIDKIEITDLNGNLSTYEIADIDTKTKIPTDLFTFNPTDSMQVIDMRH